MSFYYAQINANNICEVISQLSGLVDAPHMIAITQEQFESGSVLGQQYNSSTQTWVTLPPPEPTPESRHITVGAFFDRFGNQKWPILADTNTGVQALIKDASVRAYINLDDPQVEAGLNMVVGAGHAIDVQAIITAPIEPNERPK